MPRKRLIRSTQFPYHVTARANNKELFSLPTYEVWKIMTSELLLLSVLYEIRIHAFVLMPNHFHLLITTPKEDLGKIMNAFMSNVTKAINLHSNRSGHVFGGPYFWSIITSTRYYGHVLKYIYRNPVRGMICDRVDEYEFSTITGISGKAHLPFPIYFTDAGLEINIPDPHFFSPWLEWLNQPFPSEAEKLIKKCLRMKEINVLLDRSSRTKNELLEQLM